MDDDKFTGVYGEVDVLEQREFAVVLEREVLELEFHAGQDKAVVLLMPTGILTWIKFYRVGLNTLPHGLERFEITYFDVVYDHSMMRTR